jgi:hypothetical protein
MGPSMHAYALGPITSNFEAYDFKLFSKNSRPYGLLILKQFFELFVPNTWRLIVSARLQKFDIVILNNSRKDRMSIRAILTKP